MMTTDTERIAALETQVAALTARDERREAEHRDLLNSHAKLAADRETMRLETDETMKLFKNYWDDRIAGWQQRLASGDGDGETLAVLFPLFAADMAQFLYTALDRQEVRILERVTDWFAKEHQISPR